jgi:hypothetical protein
MTKPSKPGALEKWIAWASGKGGLRRPDLLKVLRAAKRDRDRLDWLLPTCGMRLNTRRDVDAAIKSSRRGK